MAKKSARQLDAEIEAALRRPCKSSHLTKPTPVVSLHRAMADANKTVLAIAQLARPSYKGKGGAVALELASHVDLVQPPPPTIYADALVWLYGTFAVKPVGAGGGSRRAGQPLDTASPTSTEIPVGAAYVSAKKKPWWSVAKITVYLPPLESSAVDVAVDAALEAGGITPEIDEVLGRALQGRGGLLRKAYVAAVVRRAHRLAENEARAANR